MYSDLLFNFTQMIEDEGQDYGAEVLSQVAASKPLFVMDSGIKAHDIWHRADVLRECTELMGDETKKSAVRQMLYFSAGVMPDLESVENRYDYVAELEENITSFKDSDDEFASRLVALGPCGIDHDWESVEYEGRDHDYFDTQTVSDERDLFALELTLGKKLNMPVIVHSRKGFKETSDVLKAVKWNKGVIHGYSYSKSELDFFLDLGWYISFSGAVTYAGKRGAEDMAEIVTYVPKDRILIESDSPYYAPVPLKSSKNTPLNINYIYEYVAAKRGVSTPKLSSAVDENFKKLFLN
ncbi:TatD family hydrolase [Treponema sp.]|uniref:TatD family hydrolase n=1 Tax=Treponema sp. TaxID=166 RepID=UPI00257C2094|nr:TatD family hydrolase [Treponema sp.]MBE6355421.1 TatD family deoxyribonuclease [Treponema sp.]